MGAIRRFWDNDSAMSEIIGTLLLIGITVTLIGSLSLVVLSVDPPIDELHADLSVQTTRGTDNTWNTGDEELRVYHLSGEPIPATGLSIQTNINGVNTVYAGTFTGALADGELTLGEVWTVLTTVDVSSTVSIQMVYDSGKSSELVFTGTTTAGNSCDGDSAPPNVATWGQSPANLDGLSTGPVSVTVTIVDVCSPLAAGMDPHLHYRIVGGTPAAYTDLGSMTALGSNQWTLDIPEPVDTWALNAGNTLQYYVSGIADSVGNAGDSNSRTDVVGLVGGTTFTDAFLANKGSLVNFGNAQNDADATSSATLTQDGGAPPTLVHAQGSGKNGGSGSHGNVKGAPDNLYYILSDGTDWVRADTFTNTGTGTITKVEAVFVGHYESILVDDRMDLLVKVPGGSDTTVLNDFVPNYLTNSQFVVDITNLDTSGSWSWADVQGTEVTARHDQKGTNDLMTVNVDSLYLRVTTSVAGPEMDIELEFPPLPPSPNHLLELNYRTTQTTFSVQVWDGATWNTRGDPLDQVVFTTWTYALTLAEQSADVDSPLIRIVGTAAPGATPGTVVLDYAKVESA